MKERPILFRGEMVRAILAGRKTQTRRTCNWQPHENASIPHYIQSMLSRCKYGKQGDRLWVKETFAHDGTETFYRADDRLNVVKGPWKPSIFMPRKCSRLTLEITGVRVERLHEMTESDAEAEGCPAAHLEHTEDCCNDHCALAGGVDDCCGYLISAKLEYQALWKSIHGPASWDSNPWVWAIEFKRV